MAVVLEKNYSRCQITLQNGVDNEGNPIFVSRTFGRINPDTSHQDLYDVMQALLDLQELPVRVIRRLDDGELISE